MPGGFSPPQNGIIGNLPMPRPIPGGLTTLSAVGNVWGTQRYHQLGPKKPVVSRVKYILHFMEVIMTIGSHLYGSLLRDAKRFSGDLRRPVGYILDLTVFNGVTSQK